MTQPSESESVEPTEVAEAEPGVEFLVESEENQDNQLSMIPCTYLNWVNLVISFGYLWVMHIMLYIAFFTYLYVLPFLEIILSLSLSHDS